MRSQVYGATGRVPASGGRSVEVLALQPVQGLLVAELLVSRVDLNDVGRDLDLSRRQRFRGRPDVGVPLPRRRVRPPGGPVLALDLDITNGGGPCNIIDATRAQAVSTSFQAAVCLTNNPNGVPVAAFKYKVLYNDTLIAAPEVADAGTALDDNPDANAGTTTRSGSFAAMFSRASTVMEARSPSNAIFTRTLPVFCPPTSNSSAPHSAPSFVSSMMYISCPGGRSRWEKRNASGVSCERLASDAAAAL